MTSSRNTFSEASKRSANAPNTNAAAEKVRTKPGGDEHRTRVAPACYAAQSSEASLLTVAGIACQFSGNSASRLRTFGKSLYTM